MDPLINWEAIHKLSMPPMMQGRQKPDPEGEQRFADFYNKIAAMEKKRTLDQVNALPLLPDDTLLDMGCGPGRLSIPLAQRVKSVTSLDMSDAVLRYCAENARTAGVTNLTTKKLDFHDAVPDKNIKKHDVVICSRSVGLGNLRKLSTFATRMVAIVTFANAPTIPHLLSGIFKDTTAAPTPSFLKHEHNRNLNYNVLFNIVYDMGYEPTVRILEDGFTRDYASQEEAETDILTLSLTMGKVDTDRMNIFRKNLSAFLTPNNSGGVTFSMETRTCVIWWLIHNREFFQKKSPAENS